jgi:hypothetical protein
MRSSSLANGQPAKHVVSPDLNAFKFPRQDNTSTTVARSQSAKVEPAGKARRTSEDRSLEEAGASQPAKTPPEFRNLHSPSSSNDSAVAKFIEAGRAVGLNDEQLQEMLVAKGMLNRSQESASMRSQPSTAATSAATAPSPSSLASAAASLARAPSTEKKSGGAKGLFRSLSRKKSRPSLPDTAAKQPQPPVQASQPPPDPLPRNTIVRRTLVLPDNIPPSLHTLDSPASSHGRPSPNTRKLSVKRKPLNLTREDQALVQNSPPPHQRKTSIGTTSSAVSEHANNPGLGFLHPAASLGRSASSIHASEGETASLARSSTGGSLYDLYGGYGGDENEETLISPSTSGNVGLTESLGKRLTQAIEIKWVYSPFEKPYELTSQRVCRWQSGVVDC